MRDSKSSVDPAQYEEQTEEEMLAEVAAARKAGTLRRGGLSLQRTPAAGIEKLLSERKRDGIEPTIPVTVRMPASMVATLKEQAERQGVRGYQTLMKRWVQERLTGERAISPRDVESALREVHKVELALERLLK